jgi:hypothetical protein
MQHPEPPVTPSELQQIRYFGKPLSVDEATSMRNFENAWRSSKDKKLDEVVNVQRDISQQEMRMRQLELDQQRKLHEEDIAMRKLELAMRERELAVKTDLLSAIKAKSAPTPALLLNDDDWIEAITQSQTD